MATPFLTATWANLFLATYAVPAELLRPRLPPGLELDTRDGQAYASLVGFEFLDTRVFGISWPGYRNFAELNLRFYVRHGADRGVIFIREFVSQRLVAWIARWIYNEPYRVAPIAGHITDNGDHVTAEYRLHYGGRDHVLRATGSRPAHIPGEDSVEHFFKEHHWGFGVTRAGVGMRYEVAHPPWQIYPVRSHHIDLDWGLVYGPEWACMNGATPMSTILAIGSPIAVFPKGKLVPSEPEASVQPKLAMQTDAH